MDQVASGRIDIRPGDLRTVRAILRLVLPGAEVSVFGSRATGSARRGSDLDLAIDADRPLLRTELVSLAEAFEDSDLPFAVDIIDMRSVADGFAALVRQGSLPLPPEEIGG